MWYITQHNMQYKSWLERKTKRYHNQSYSQNVCISISLMYIHIYAKITQSSKTLTKMCDVRRYHKCRNLCYTFKKYAEIFQSPMSYTKIAITHWN